MAFFPGTNGDDNLTGTSAADTFEPRLGDDAASGLAGDDTITYAGGADLYEAGGGVDTVVVPEALDAARFVDSTGSIPAGFSGTFLDGRGGGSPLGPNAYFYDTGGVADGNGLLLRDVELVQFQDVTVDTRVSQLLPVTPDDAPTSSGFVGIARGEAFVPPGSSFAERVAVGIPFEAGPTANDGTFGAPASLEIVAVNGTPVDANGRAVDVAVENGSIISVPDQSTVLEGHVTYTPGRDFLKTLTGPDVQLFLGERVVDQTVTVTGRDEAGRSVDVSFPVDVIVSPQVFEDNFRDSNVNGDEGPDRIEGFGGDDYLSGGAGVDTLEGGGGADTIFANNRLSTDDAGDTVTGNDGEDVLGAGPGGDFIAGDSVLVGGGALTWLGAPTGVAASFAYGAGDPERDDGSDELFGAAGNDFIVTGGVSSDDAALLPDEITGFADDTAYGGDGNDVMVGANGFDSLFGSPGNDSLYGGGGDDNVGGAIGNDVVLGDAGDDVVSGAAGADVLSGGDGDDTLFAATGDDLLTGGLGADVFWVGREAGASDRVTDFTAADGDVIALGGFGLAWPTLEALLDAAGATRSAVIALPNGLGGQTLDLRTSDVDIQDLVRDDFIL